MMQTIRFLRALAVLAPLLPGCVPADPAAPADPTDPPDPIDFEPYGWVNQGTFTDGTVEGVSEFLYTGWWNSGMRLKDTGVVDGHLVATWDRTADCTSAELQSPDPLARSCGWHGAGWSTCTPGLTVSVGAGGCDLGWSSTDSMLRICKGDKPCAADAALAENDDTPAGSGCTASSRPRATFTCPGALPGKPSKYFVMVSPKSGDSSFSYSIGATGVIQPPTFQTALVDAPCSKCSSQLVGTTISTTPGGVTYRIAAAKAEDASTSFYTLEKEEDRTPLCLDGATPAQGAIPMTGRWEDADGTHQESTTTFTFGCTAGVLAKCYRLGYRPWALSTGGESLRDYHQTCTRALRADYCGNGGSHTVNGTPIDIWDRIPFVQPEADETQYPVEAVWRRDLEPLGPEPGRIGGPVCLAKERWETIPINGCGALTPDPRTDPNVRYCHQRSVDGNGWFANNTQDIHNLIANRSAFIDAGLWRWKRFDGKEYRSTTKLSTTGGPLDPAYPFTPTAPEPEPVLIGSVYALVTSEGLRPHHTIPLYTHFNENDYLTNTSPTPPSSDYDPDDTVEEGYILSPACATIPGCPTTKALRLYHNAATGDYATDTSPPAGYQEKGLLGYLPR